jgi:hypothetical protein
MFWLNVGTTFNFEDPKKSLRISFVELSAPKDIIYFESQMLELKSHEHDDDSEVKSTVPETSPPSSVGAIVSGMDDDGEEEEEQERKPIPSRKLNGCGDIKQSRM